MGADAVFSPANYGPVFARNHVILLRNATSVITLTTRLRPMAYWMMLSGATFVSLLLAKRAIAVSEYAARIYIWFAALVQAQAECRLSRYLDASAVPRQ